MIMTNPTTSMNRSRHRGRLSTLALAGVGAVLLSACDLGVFDPGSIEYDDLFNPSAIDPLLIGAERNLGRAISGERNPHGGVFGFGAYVSDEIVHVGQWVGMREWSDAVDIDPSVAETSTRWAHAQNARVTAEEAGSIIRQILTDQGSNADASEKVATAYMWAGFSNRVLGDHFCSATIDGGPEQPVSAFYERAEQYFSNAINVAQAANDADLARAARAGRAQVRMMLGNWSGAASDAAEIPMEFVHEVRMDGATAAETNGLHDAFMRNAQASVWGTPFAAWGIDLSGVQQTEGDPRIQYASRNAAGNPVVSDGRRQFWEPRKYLTRDDNIPMAKGTEMRLIRAEAALVGGDITAALAHINAVRAHRELDPVTAGTTEEAWYVLQKERGIELWVEGRRLPDLRRWAQTPGYANFDVVRRGNPPQPPETDEVRNVLDNPLGELCMPMSLDERNSNPNL
jgi:starch-binding outer membrane protein, SusD/RagB family